MARTKQASTQGSSETHLTPHPEGYIRLMDNSLLQLYPTAQPHEGFAKDQVSEVFDFFQQHLPLFWKHRNRILSDSRMFLAPIPSVNGLAYVGSFPDLTLGVYLELWGICEPATRRDDEGTLQFVTRIAGSPLSDANRCTFVSEQGKIEKEVWVSSFRTLWKELDKLIKRYKGLEKTYACYSLEEVVERLQGKLSSPEEEPQVVHTALDPSERYDAVKTVYAYSDLRERWEDLQQEHAKAIELLHRYVVRVHRAELTKLYEDHRQLSEAWAKREAEIKEERRAIRHRLRHGEPNSRELQLSLKALKEEELKWHRRLGDDYRTQIHDVFPDFPIPSDRLGELLALK